MLMRVTLSFRELIGLGKTLALKSLKKIGFVSSKKSFVPLFSCTCAHRFGGGRAEFFVAGWRRLEDVDARIKSAHDGGGDFAGCLGVDLPAPCA